MRCPSCQAENPAASRFCNTCGAAMDASAIPTVAMQERRTPSSSGSSDEGRFPAGTILGERYRVLGLLGRGGMGEVYRAHDLKLEQQVALKFLPPATARDSRLLERFRGEVRIARQVSHRNVCRVFDLGEVEGSPYISMEYVDGEDLGSLLRRIGRLPGDKAIEFARRLCAGLAAAHEKGVLHRDLKPANIMIDGRGQVLIMDFGLAAVSDGVAGGDIRSGTPAYMAPEQKEGREVTVRSDIYSLGLVLAEMFTGQKDSKLSATVKDLDPAVEKVIQRCLDPNPSKRPQSALDVARALPGGDPLAEALAAGDTPSPEMVAASDDTGALSVRAAVICLVAVAAGLIAITFLRPYVLPPLPDPPDLLARKARDLAVRFGYTDSPGDSAYGFGGTGPPAFLRWAQKEEKPEELRAQLISGDPPVISFWYRQSPGTLLPISQDGIVMPNDPPHTERNIVTVTLDQQGRMTAFVAQAPRDAAAMPPARPMDWKVVFEAAGLDQSLWNPVQLEQIPDVAFDQRAAWTGSYPKAPSIPMRIEAASFKGRLVSFSTRGPWDPPIQLGDPLSLPTRANLTFGLIYVGFLLLLGAAVFLAWRNYSRGRGDAQGSWRLAAFNFVCGLLLWILSAHQVAGPFLFAGLIDGLGKPLYHMAVVWVFYMALEPYVRRRWPQSLISWTRVLNGGFRDPMVAGHLLFGLALGIGMEALWRAVTMIQSHYGGVVLDPSISGAPQPSSLGGATLAWSVVGGVQIGIEASCVLLLLVFLVRALLRRTWLFTAGVVVLSALPIFIQLALSGIPNIYGPGFGPSVYFSVGFLAGVLTLFRLGLLPAVVTLIANITVSLYVASDFSAWYAGPCLVLLAVFLAAAVWSFRNALGGRRLLEGDILEG